MITIKIEGSDIAAALQRLASGMAHPGPVMPVVAGILHDAVMENFAKGGRPSWQALKPATLAYKKKHGVSPAPTGIGPAAATADA